MILSNIYESIENFSRNILSNLFINTETSVGTFFNNIVLRLIDWTFILIATLISAIVAVKLERKFANKIRLHNKKLLKEAFSESLSTTLTIFIYIFFIFLFLAFLYFLVKWGMRYSSFLTLLFLISILIGYILWKKHKKDKKIANLKGQKTHSN